MLLWIWLYRHLFEILLLSLLGVYSEVEFLDHKVILFLFFWGTTTLLSYVIGTSTILHLQKQHQGFNFFNNFFSYQHLLFPGAFESSFPSECDVVSHCGFELHLPNNWTSFCHFNTKECYLCILFDVMGMCAYHTSVIVICIQFFKTPGHIPLYLILFGWCPLDTRITFQFLYS